ncbi:ChaN family lipoprotein [Mongoliitalea daihaiensis]|uniref:ChaN family lipoprotein n=1 Tax=Mongoliitalea daihaiensis TaxID=2782006 RepID=UPI001F384F1C|nr:ChaN family lipoprotein [Mongoliitalea daihaiensis]UJP64686.1 ChaN family lipoprotein [Mongoliitalea daihaiensis]
MTKHIFGIILLIILSWSSHAQTTSYRVFDKSGREVSFEAIVEEAKGAQLIFFGELHNNTVAHWLQLQLLKSLQPSNEKLMLAGEFFERDDQLNIDEWMAGWMTDKSFETEAKLWNNYATDYKPLMLFAKTHQIPFIASNIPRKYASLVSKEGLEGLEKLSSEAKQYIAPLPVTVDRNLPAYAAMREMMHGSSMNLDFMIDAQAIKDATMAYSMQAFLAKGHQILHVNGSYHSNFYEGIVWYIRQEFPSLPILTINTVEQADLSSIDERMMLSADFIIVTPTDIPKSY